VQVDSTSQQLAKLGLTQEEGSEYLRLTTKLKQNHEAMVQNGEIAQRSFREWLSDVIPEIGKALKIAANTISDIIRGVAEILRYFN